MGNPYFIASESADLQCYPNYSFEIGDVDADGKMEFASLDQTGNTLRVHNLDGALLFEKTLANNGNWGTALVAIWDVNNDGRAEIIVPDGKKILVLDGQGRVLAEREFWGCRKDGYQINIPLLGVAKTPRSPVIVAALAGGVVVALDASLNTLWETPTNHRDFGHEIHFADVDGDGFDEIAFCAVDNIGGPPENNVGEFFLLDHDGTVMFRRRVGDYFQDTHFDDVAMADFTGDGTCQILVEKGVLLDLKGNVIWDLSKEMAHGQWIAHAPAPDGKGRVGFISELWGGEGMRSMMFHGRGEKIRDIKGFPWPKMADADSVALPARCHTVQWDKNSTPEIFLTQQIVGYGGHGCDKPRRATLTGLFMDLHGNLVGEMPFEDAQIPGYYYNGETHSKVADVDGDGRQEIVMVKQDGRVAIIKKRLS